MVSPPLEKGGRQKLQQEPPSLQVVPGRERRMIERKTPDLPKRGGLGKNKKVGQGKVEKTPAVLGKKKSKTGGESSTEADQKERKPWGGLHKRALE